MSSIKQPADVLKGILRKNYEYLVNELKVSIYLDAFFANRVISEEDLESLRRVQGRVEQGRTLLRILLVSSEDSIRNFFKILKTREDKQPHIYEHLFRVSVLPAEHHQQNDDYTCQAFLAEQGWQYDVFICHTGADMPFIEMLYAEMAKCNLKAFSDKESLMKGQPVQATIAEAIIKSPFFLVVLSHSFVNQEYPEAELKAALAFHGEYKKLIMPVFYKMFANECHHLTKTMYRRLSDSAGWEKRTKSDKKFAESICQKLKEIVEQELFYGKVKVWKPNGDDWKPRSRGGLAVLRQLTEDLKEAEKEQLSQQSQITAGASTQQQVNPLATTAMKGTDPAMAAHIADKQIISIAAIAKSQWKKIGICLGFNEHELSDYEDRFMSDWLSLETILFDWKDRECNPTLGKVFQACEDAKVGDAARRALLKALKVESESDRKNEATIAIDSKSSVKDFEPIATLNITVSPDGGRFRSGSIDIYFPPGSVSEPVNVQPKLYDDLNLMPESRDEYRVSPLLALEPHGLTFKKPIQIHFPFYVNPKGWRLFLKRSMCEISAVPQTWESIVTYDPETAQVEVENDCNFDVATATLSITHFCWHQWVGWFTDKWMASKNMQFSVYARRKDPSMNVLSLTVYCHNICDEARKKVENEEAKKHGESMLLDAGGQMPVALNGGELTFTTEGEWKMQNAHPDPLPAERCYESFSCTAIPVSFVVKHCPQTNNNLGLCAIRVNQGSSSAQIFNDTLPLAPNQEMSAETLKWGLPPMTGSNNLGVTDLVPSSSLHHQSAEVESHSEERSPMKQSVKKFRILVVIDGWSSTKGGIQTFSRAMCKELAKEKDVEIACMVTERTTEDDDDAKASGVTLVLEESDELLDFLFDLQPNILIGHGIEKLAKDMVYLRRLLTTKNIPYKTVQILHVYPFLLEPKKESKGASSKANDKSDKLLAQAEKADIVAAVGPRLSKYWASNLKHKTFVPLIPGLYHYDCKSKVNRSQQVAKPLPRCLFISRLNSKEDQRSKGLDVAVQAMKLYDEQLAMENTSNAAKAIFDVRGFNDSTACDDFYGKTQPQFKNISIEAKAFDADEEKVKRDMEAADVFLMPSPEEGFGLTSLEALTCGTPVLCSENSGFAEVLRQIQDNDKDRCKFINNWIVSTTEKEDFGKQLGERIWSMLQTPETIKATYKEAEELQEQWKERYSWSKMVRTLLDEVGVLIN